MSAEARPLASVVIPTRDRIEFLKDAVASVLWQTLQPCEVVVVDDASSDGTADWLNRQDPNRVVVVRLDQHAERAVARNRGFERARAETVLFLDDDDRLRPSALRRLHSALNASRTVVGSVGARMLFDADGQRRKMPHPRRQMERTVWPELLAGWMSPPGTVLWRTDVVRRVGAWNEAITFSGDRELFLRMAYAGPVSFVPGVVLDKRVHGGQTRTADIRERKAKWMTELVDRLPSDMRRRGMAAIRANRTWNDARIAYGDLQPRRALSLYVRAVREAPLLLTSPLMRPEIGAGLVKSSMAVVVGPDAVVRARAAKRRLLSSLGRQVSEVKREASP
jgi:glycosyltransferase involved in cell wall biosynthesis